MSIEAFSLLKSKTVAYKYVHGPKGIWLAAVI